MTRRWREPDSNPRSRVSGSALFETVFTACNRSGARYAANGTSMAATDRCCLASTFMDNTRWSTPNGLALAGPHQGRDRDRVARAAAGLPGRRDELGDQIPGNAWLFTRTKSRLRARDRLRRLRASGGTLFAFSAKTRSVGIDAAIAIVDRSLALNPSCAYGWRFSGFLRLFAGQPDLAIQHFETSLRLSPRDERWAQLTGIAIAHFFEGRLDNAVAVLLLALHENPTYPLANRFLASCYAHFGRLDEAREVVARLRAITPMVIPEETNYRNPEHRELFLSGLRLAMGETT
jgi:tetratricopeptide (TPR) repeat protein